MFLNILGGLLPSDRKPKGVGYTLPRRFQHCREAMLLLDEVKAQASPFRGKYLEEGMGAPGRDMMQGLTL